MDGSGFRIPQAEISELNERLRPDLERDYESLGERLARRGIDIEEITRRTGELGLAVPSWGVATGGTRFGRFPGDSEPRDLLEKFQDVSTIHQLTGATPRVSLHIPWDRPRDAEAVRSYAAALGLSFDAMNSNTFQDQPGQPLSYKFGSLGHADPAVRRQAIEHNKEVIDIGVSLGSKALTVWIGDGGSYPGQVHHRRALDRVLASLAEIYAHLPEDWRLFVEYKPFEPAFYSTIIQDWGTAYVLSSRLGAKAYTLVDLGHHLPNTNVEMVVARLIALGKLGGFHLNDSKYADDDLTAGSIKPYQLFLIFCELVDAEEDPDVPDFQPAYMIDQSHNEKDPIEALVQTVDEAHRQYARALLVDRKALAACQDANDVVSAEEVLRQAFNTDVMPVVRMARLRNGGAVDPLDAFRSSGYRRAKAKERRGGLG